MELQKATENDLELIIDLWIDLGEEMVTYSEFNELDEEVRGTAEEGWRKKLQSQKINVYLIKQDGKIVGFTDIKTDQHKTRKISRYTKIVDLFIEENYRSQGIGTEVVEEIKVIADEKGSEYLKVSSEWDNERARKFYEENGFTEKQIKYVQKLDKS